MNLPFDIRDIDYDGINDVNKIISAKMFISIQIWVRSHTADSSKTVITGSEVTLACTFEGDTVESYSWEMKGTTLEDGGDYEIPAVTWEAASNSLTSTLKIKSATESADYVCKGTYTTGTTVVSSTHTVTVLGRLSLKIVRI